MANEQNLKPWKPGQSGNPSGKPRGDRSIKILTNEQVKEIMDVVLTNDIERLDEIKKSKSSSTLQAWIAAIALRGLRDGDPARLEALLRRTVGTVKESISVENTVVFKPASPEDLKKALATDPFIELPSESITHLASSSVENSNRQLGDIIIGNESDC